MICYYLLYYLKVKGMIKEIEKKIQEMDSSFYSPINNIIFTKKYNGTARVGYKKRKIVLEITPKALKSNFKLVRILTHELMHLWIGTDFLSGDLQSPQSIYYLNKEFGDFKKYNFSFRMSLSFFLHQNAIFKKKFRNMHSIEGYGYAISPGVPNPYRNFEEVLIDYATMKLHKDNIDTYLNLKEIFDKGYDDKELLLFVDDVMPNIKEAIRKLVFEYN